MQINDTLHAFLWQSMTSNNCNTYFINGAVRVLIDPGHMGLFDHVQTHLSDLGMSLADIDLVICTHGHPDHLEAVQRFSDTQTLFAFGDTEWQWMKSMKKHLQAGIGLQLDAMVPDFLLQEGHFRIRDLAFQVYHTPGHSPGSICIYWPEFRVLFTGDLIFKEGLGRTDLPGGNGQLLKESIKKMSELDVEWLLSGHGNIIAGLDQVKRNFEQVERFWFSYI